jgi:acyl-CoA hydrolase
MLSETTRDIEGIGRIETIYADLGIRKYWVLKSDYTIELNNVEGVEHCARVRSNVTDIGATTMTVDNGVYVFTIEYEVTGDELVATIVDSDEPDAIGGSWKGRATDGDPYELAGCQ